MSLHRQRVGKCGEELAVLELVARGYAILARRYRTRHGEIDIIAEHQGALVFVEVKARLTGEYGGAAAAVTLFKQRRLTTMAVLYLARSGRTSRPCRFDVVAIDDAGGTHPRVSVYQSAFDAQGDTHL